MAKMTIKGMDEYALKLAKLGAASDAIAEKAIAAGTNIVADKIRSNLHEVLSGESTGDMEKSLGITPLSRDKDGNLNMKVGFHGYDRKGVANKLKARVIESGSPYRGIKGRPFVRTAVKATKKAAQAEMGRVIDEETEKIMK
ncbi:HK97-gp10 family putative phage morphogenesis protein [Faecalispora jeddahensis]|uniref:HK97-gp10 family putative phage morphogenesis protein n=1 Tax=Faecalispora jeddahensis TaxID=1414721 RepID=UPI0028A5CB73|nr:HK97-gp10 family putative phage morphogenesis protein [Faecalispora jeddahensis]